jgi:hypothetical protein
MVKLIIAALLADGHVIEGVPGVAKHYPQISCP